ncbi:zf-HC2 domain-containing protein [Paenibacillus sp. GD4]|uniref:anti-sigma factor family protein n=1 Tax=Paenibacillus sp. GD4 TaxID=3068890 RepID=UPI0027963E2E|nr:zf-HC2 domain-containing protein [Paenibacillus sp. GD4]MDQ1911781.1 zf-HC2 domain-containing protein [Paenibacillus sp. GD4]
MTHPTREQWLDYAGGRMTEEQREHCDLHLAQCDECLMLYMDCLGAVSNEMPQLADPAELTERVLKQLPPVLVPSEPHRSRLWSHPVFHYAVAAAITLLLVSTGIFQALLGSTGQHAVARASLYDNEYAAQQSFSSRLLDKTVLVLDSIQSKTERGGKR